MGRLADCPALQSLNVAIFSNTINIINGKHCMMIVLMYEALPSHIIFSDFDFISRSQQCQTVLTEKFVFFPFKFKLCTIVDHVMSIMNIRPIFLNYIHVQGR